MLINKYYILIFAEIFELSKTITINSLLFLIFIWQNNFLPLLDLFHKENIKVDVCKIIVEGFGAQNGPITDPIVINALMFIMKIIHDSVR